VACTVSRPRMKSLSQIRSARDCHFAWTKIRGALQRGGVLEPLPCA
jgi:hypothetical protein